ncbi:MAG: hypothetical protein ACJAQ3_001541 [Planctomycetota bacterium]|jgi:hypothetical protein
MWLTTLLNASLRLAALVAVGWVAGPLIFRPAPGSTLTKCLVNEWKLHLDELDVVINDVPWWTGYTIDTELSQRIVVADTYLALQGGRPIALDRAFKTISQDLEISMGGGPWNRAWENVCGTSALEGAVVQFRREEGADTKRFHPLGRRLDDELLDGLTEDMDLRILLPKKAARVGDEWEVDLAYLPDLLSPGGYFAWTIESGGSTQSLNHALDPALMGELRYALGAMLEGHVTVTYAGEEDGYSQLELSIEVEGTKEVDDLSKLATKIVDEFPDWGTIEVERLDLAFALEARGTAEWDTQRGHIYDLQLNGELESTMDLEVIWDVGSEFSIEVRTVTSGNFKQSLDTP